MSYDIGAQNLSIKAGITQVNLKPSSGNALDPKMSYVAGLQSQFDINERFFVQPEVLYARMGHTWVNMDYLRVPMAVGYRPVNLLDILLGPEIGFLIAAEGSSKTLDAGMMVGLQYSILPKIKIGPRYFHGLIAVDKIELTDENGNALKPIEWHNSAAELSVSYTFWSN